MLVSGFGSDQAKNIFLVVLTVCPNLGPAYFDQPSLAKACQPLSDTSKASCWPPLFLGSLLSHCNTVPKPVYTVGRPKGLPRPLGTFLDFFLTVHRPPGA